MADAAIARRTAVDPAVRGQTVIPLPRMALPRSMPLSSGEETAAKGSPVSTRLLYEPPPPGYPKQYRDDRGEESAVPVTISGQPSNIAMVCGSGEESAVPYVSYTGLPTVRRDSGEDTVVTLMADCLQNATGWIRAGANSEITIIFNEFGACPVAEVDSIAFMSQGRAAYACLANYLTMLDYIVSEAKQLATIGYHGFVEHSDHLGGGT